jgi:hypothetical protein
LVAVLVELTMLLVELVALVVEAVFKHLALAGLALRVKALLVEVLGVTQLRLIHLAVAAVLEAWELLQMQTHQMVMAVLA